MKPAHRIFSVITLAVLAAPSLAASTTYTTSSAFLPHVASGYYTETFSAFGDPGPQPPLGAVGFSGGSFAYTVAAPSDLYGSGEFLGTSQIDEALTITFTSGNVYAVGANFYATNFSNVFQAVSLTLTLSDGTTTTFTPTSASDSYRGFVSDLAITSLVVSAPGQSLYAGIDNLTVGGAVTSVPEPSTWALFGLGVTGLLVTRRRAV